MDHSARETCYCVLERRLISKCLRCHILLFVQFVCEPDSMASSGVTPKVIWRGNGAEMARIAQWTFQNISPSVIVSSEVSLAVEALISL